MEDAARQRLSLELRRQRSSGSEDTNAPSNLVQPAIATLGPAMLLLAALVFSGRVADMRVHCPSQGGTKKIL